MKKGKDYPTDMMQLYQALVARGIKCKMRVHPAFEAEPKAKEILGYYPAGESQIIIEKDGVSYSVIRGMVSFGYYEIMNMDGGEKFADPERFVTPDDLIDAL